MYSLSSLSILEKEKIKIETTQRVREKARKDAGLPYNAKYFMRDSDASEDSADWKFKNEVIVNRDFIEYLPTHSPSPYFPGN